MRIEKMDNILHESTFELKYSTFYALRHAYETVKMLQELDPVKNSAEDYRDAVCAILEMKGYR